MDWLGNKTFCKLERSIFPWTGSDRIGHTLLKKVELNNSIIFTALHHRIGY